MDLRALLRYDLWKLRWLLFADGTNIVRVATIATVAIVVVVGSGGD